MQIFAITIIILAITGVVATFVRRRLDGKALAPAQKILPGTPTEGLWVKPEVYALASKNPVGILSILPALLDGKLIRLGIMHYGMGWEKIIQTADINQFDRLICCHPQLLPSEWKAKFILDLPWEEMNDVNYLITKVGMRKDGRLYCWVEDQFGFVWAANFAYTNVEVTVEGDDTEIHQLDFFFETVVVEEEEVEGDDTAQYKLDLFFVETIVIEE